MPAITVSKHQALEELRRQENECRHCVLQQGGTHYVFGAGEAPGAEEDRTGEPFTGRAGKLLNTCIAAIGLSRQEAYITNVVKCRPLRDPDHPAKAGNDRPPNKKEIRACLPVLERQIEIIRPQVICTLGTTPVQALCATDEGITALHGKTVDYKGMRLVPTFHPAAVFHNPRLLQSITKDFKIVKELLLESS
ncbi:MAG: uracil-DNA glycosylase [Endomicrobiales bacterium]